MIVNVVIPPTTTPIITPSFRGGVEVEEFQALPSRGFLGMYLR